MKSQQQKIFEGGEKRSTLASVEESQFITIILSRAIQTLDGYAVNRNKTISTNKTFIRQEKKYYQFAIKSYNFRDSCNSGSYYEAIAVIEFKGELNDYQESSGHYICDVKEKSSNCWFRANDNYDPIQIDVTDVSKYGYVILLKKMENQIIQ